ncbi:cell division protein FtsQ/DivIB [Reinekea thalattae]|uniref:Cell division protein FtsQ n=1 Tax=Reinekea thalattae TaxID=2593301 RepID=A0A5C8Z420_9GAMM|nr:cell division protein FtsQ/DivIB [Reinekea thalattae]TXR51999.1 FtsQ-type POTRA domain-containing protein [Reinekea thalattae]
MQKTTKARGATRRKTSNKRRLNLPWRQWFSSALKPAAVVLIIALLVVSISFIKRIDWQPIPVQQISLADPLAYQDEQGLRQVSDRFIGTSLLLLDIEEVQQSLQQLPWVKQVSVRKQWPGELEVLIEEHEPVAIWNGDQVLNSEGEPLERPANSLALASLVGPVGSEVQVMNQYLQFAQVFGQDGARLQEVKMHPRGAWQLTLENGVTISLGDEHLLARSRRVMKVLQLEAYKGSKIEYIDARYSNGVALKMAS